MPGMHAIGGASIGEILVLDNMVVDVLLIGYLIAANVETFTPPEMGYGRPTLDFTLITNNDLTLGFIVLQKSTGRPIDLSGTSIGWQAFAPGQTSPSLSKGPEDIQVADQADAPGLFFVPIKRIETAQLTDGAYRHEAVITLPDDTVHTVLRHDAMWNRLKPGFMLVRRQLTPPS